MLQKQAHPMSSFVYDTNWRIPDLMKNNLTPKYFLISAMLKWSIFIVFLQTPLPWRVIIGYTQMHQ